MYKTINEAHGLAKADIKKVKDLIDMFEDKEIKRILKFLVKSNVEVDKTQDVTKMKKENKHPMKITRKNLKNIIKEETEKVLRESPVFGFKLDVGSKLVAETVLQLVKAAAADEELQMRLDLGHGTEVLSELATMLAKQLGIPGDDEAVTSGADSFR